MRTAGFLFLAATFAATAQESPRAGGEQVYVTAIEVVADVRDAAGKLPLGLQPGDFVVIEDGVERAVVGLDYLRVQRVAGAIEVDRKPDGKTRKIEVRPRDRSLEVRAARLGASATPDDMAQTRAVGLLKNSGYLGDLALQGNVEWSAAAGPKSGTLHAVTDIGLVKRLLPTGAKAQFRITLAVQIGREAVVVNRSVPDHELTRAVFRFRTPLELPPTASAIVLVIEETTTGVWGSTRLDIPNAKTPSS